MLDVNIKKILSEKYSSNFLVLCMGGLILTVIEIAKTIASIGNDKTSRAVYQTYSLTVLITKIISYTFRFLFHCVQYSFLFRYGNVSISSLK